MTLPIRSRSPKEIPMAPRTETDSPDVHRPAAALLLGALFLTALVLELVLAFLNPNEAMFAGDGGTGGLGLIPYFVLSVLTLGFGLLTMLTAGAAMGKRGTLARFFALLLFFGAALRVGWPFWTDTVRVFDEGTGGATSIDPVIAFTTGEGPFLVEYVAAGATLLGLLGLLAFGSRASRRIRRLLDQREDARIEARDARRRLDAQRRDERGERDGRGDGTATGADATSRAGSVSYSGREEGDASTARDEADADAQRDPRERDRDERTRAARESICDERHLADAPGRHGSPSGDYPTASDYPAVENPPAEPPTSEQPTVDQPVSDQSTVDPAADPGTSPR